MIDIQYNLDWEDAKLLPEDTLEDTIDTAFALMAEELKDKVRARRESDDAEEENVDS